MRTPWKYQTKNGITWLRPSSLTCPFTIKVGLAGEAHEIFDVRLYQNGGSTQYKLIGKSYNMSQAQNILRTAWRKEK
jgi:hypothetical protein